MSPVWQRVASWLLAAPDAPSVAPWPCLHAVFVWLAIVVVFFCTRYVFLPLEVVVACIVCAVACAVFRILPLWDSASTGTWAARLIARVQPVTRRFVSLPALHRARLHHARQSGSLWIGDSHVRGMACLIFFLLSHLQLLNN